MTQHLDATLSASLVDKPHLLVDFDLESLHVGQGPVARLEATTAPLPQAHEVAAVGQPVFGGFHAERLGVQVDFVRREANLGSEGEGIHLTLHFR